MKTHYETLEVEKTATLPEIRKAYHKLALKHHPDRNKGSKESEDVFRLISAAYGILSDERQRKMYDHELNKPAPRAAPGGYYTPPPPPDMEGWTPKQKYKATRQSWFWQQSEAEARRRAQNGQRTYNGGTGVSVDPFGDGFSTGLQAPIELGKPLPIVGTPPPLGESLKTLRGPWGDLPGFFFFQKGS